MSSRTINLPLPPPLSTAARSPVKKRRRRTCLLPAKLSSRAAHSDCSPPAAAAQRWLGVATTPPSVPGCCPAQFERTLTSRPRHTSCCQTTNKQKAGWQMQADRRRLTDGAKGRAAEAHGRACTLHASPGRPSAEARTCRLLTPRREEASRRPLSQGSCEHGGPQIAGPLGIAGNLAGCSGRDEGIGAGARRWAVGEVTGSRSAECRAWLLWDPAGGLP